MENISCMRFMYLCEFLTGIEETYTYKNDKSFRISRSARKKLEQLGLCKIDKETEVKVKYNPSSNVVDITVLGYVFDSVVEDIGEILELVDSFNVYATVDSMLHFDLRLINIYKGMPRYPGRLKIR